MLPKIEKINLTGKELMPAAKLEIKLLRQQLISIKGFKFIIRHNRCVLLGQENKNDFDLISAAAQVQEYARNITVQVPDKFRFAFI